MRIHKSVAIATMVSISIGTICTDVDNLAHAADGFNVEGIEEGQSLEDFYAAAIEFSPELRIAKENLNVGRAREEQAQGQLQPQISANANLTDNSRNSFSQFGQKIEEDFVGERYSLNFQQVLFNWQAFSARRRAAQIENQLEAEYFFELSRLMTDVAGRYLNVLIAQDALITVAAELQAISSQRDQIQSLYDLQLAQITDLRQAEASLIAVQADQLKLQSELELAQEALRAMTGIEVGDIYSLPDDATLPNAQRNLQAWLSMADRNNKRLQARRYALEAAREGISESQGASMPRVNFFATQQESNVGFDNRFLGDTDNTFIGIDVSIPIYAGGANRARENEARAQRNIAENELRRSELEARANVRSAFLQVQSSTLLTEAAKRLVESTRLFAEAAQEGFALGTVTNVDVLNALRDRFQAERELQRTRYNQINQLLLLKLEAGTLNSGDILEISRLMVAPAP